MANYNIAKKGKAFKTDSGVPACEVLDAIPRLVSVIAIFYGSSLAQASKMAKAATNSINEYPGTWGIEPEKWNK